MSERADELSAELSVESDSLTIAQGSVLEALRCGDFELARQAVDDAEAAWSRRLELYEQIAEMFESS